MPSFDLKELSPRHRDEHARRLRRIKRAVERRCYMVDSDQIANGIIREACSYEAVNRHVD